MLFYDLYVKIGFIMLSAYLAGLAVGGSLIIAIGAQNATLLRVGLRREHVGIAVVVCVLGDASLIALGIGGLGSVLTRSHVLLQILKWSGAAYLAFFAMRSFRAAWRGGQHLDENNQSSRANIFLTMAAVTWLNPHVYVDTVMVLGTVSTQFGHQAWWFGSGALTTSTLWFSSLGFGAKFLRPYFQKSQTWQVLDVIVGVVVLGVAINLMVSP